MPKRDTIDAIRRLNPTAAPEFLGEFSTEALSDYLDRLETASRGPAIDTLTEFAAGPRGELAVGARLLSQPGR